MKLNLKHYPLSLKILCIIWLLPILAAPFVFYGTIFFFDNPSSEEEAFVMFLAVNSYSFVLAGICWMSVWLYSKYKKRFIAMLPFLCCLAMIGGVYVYLVHGPVDPQKVKPDDYRLYRNTPCEALAKAIYWENTDEINRILARSPELLTYTDPKYHQTVFFYALFDDKLRSLEVLLKNGVNPNQIQLYRYDENNPVEVIAPLSWICERYEDEEKQLKLVQLLLDHGADVNIRFVEASIKGRDYHTPNTPLMEVAQEGNLKVVRFLLEKGADPNYRLNPLGAPALQCALIFDHYEVAEALLRHGANPDLRFYERNTSVREELLDDNRHFMSSDIKARKRLLRLIESLPKGYLTAHTTEPYLESGVPVCYLNEHGDTIVPYGKYLFCQTDTIRNIGFAYEAKRENAKIVCIDYTGKELFYVFNYDNGPDYVQEGLFRIMDAKNLIGFADTSGHVVIKPQFKFAFPFKNGKAKVTFEGKRMQIPDTKGEQYYWESDDWKYINREGEIVQ